MSPGEEWGWEVLNLLRLLQIWKKQKVSQPLLADLLIVTLSSCADFVLRRLPSPSLRGRTERKSCDLSPQDNQELLMHPFSEALVFWWDAACLDSIREGGVETGLLSITHNLYPL